MRGVLATEFGGPEVLRAATDLAEPRPADGELLVEVEAAAVLFLDTQLRAGWGRDYFDIAPPFVPGVFVAGRVVGGGAEVEPAWRGARVLANTSGTGRYLGGGYAERAVAPAAECHVVPDGVDPAHALSATDGMMALTRVARAGLRPGDTALVTAASGSIGTWLVPVLARAEVRVVAAARGESKTRLATGRGAEVAVDYGRPGWTADVPGPVDAVFDGAGGGAGTEAFALLRPGGRFFAYGSAAGDLADVDGRDDGRGIEVVGMEEDLPASRAADAVRESLRMLADGRHDAVVGLRLPLEQAADAHSALEERRVAGKTVLTP